MTIADIERLQPDTLIFFVDDQGIIPLTVTNVAEKHQEISESRYGLFSVETGPLTFSGLAFFSNTQHVPLADLYTDVRQALKTFEARCADLKDKALKRYEATCTSLDSALMAARDLSTKLLADPTREQLEGVGLGVRKPQPAFRPGM